MNINPKGFNTNYEVKYRNGSVAHPTSLEEILTQENFGSAGIIRLRMEVTDCQNSNLLTRAGVRFSNPDEDEEVDARLQPIGYMVSGADRDWVFITSSQLDERISKIKVFSPNQVSPRRRSSSFSTLPTLIWLLLTMSALIFTLIRHGRQAVNQLDAVEHNWKAGILKDPVEAAIEVARIEVGRGAVSGPDLIWPLLWMIGVPVVLLTLIQCYFYFRPSYNFLWGDYVAVYEKRLARAKFVFGGILLALAMGIVINFISKRIGI